MRDSCKQLPGKEGERGQNGYEGYKIRTLKFNSFFFPPSSVRKGPRSNDILVVMSTPSARFDFLNRVPLKGTGLPGEMNNSKSGVGHPLALQARKLPKSSGITVIEHKLVALGQRDTDVNLKGLRLADVGTAGASGRIMAAIDLYSRTCEDP